MRAAIPFEPGWTAAQHAEACMLALRRLELKRLVRRAGQSWMLAS